MRPYPVTPSSYLPNKTSLLPKHQPLQEATKRLSDAPKTTQTGFGLPTYIPGRLGQRSGSKKEPIGKPFIKDPLILKAVRLPTDVNPSKSYPGNRRCAKQRCNTILSIYNPGEYCGNHEFLALDITIK